MESNEDLEAIQKEMTTKRERSPQGDNGMATTAMILGIIGLAIGVIPFIGWFVFPLSLLAIVLGMIALSSEYKRKEAVTGIALGLILIFWKAIFWFSLLVFSMLAA